MTAQVPGGVTAQVPGGVTAQVPGGMRRGRLTVEAATLGLAGPRLAAARNQALAVAAYNRGP